MSKAGLYILLLSCGQTVKLCVIKSDHEFQKSALIDIWRESGTHYDKPETAWCHEWEGGASQAWLRPTFLVRWDLHSHQDRPRDVLTPAAPV